MVTYDTSFLCSLISTCRNEYVMHCYTLYTIGVQINSNFVIVSVTVSSKYTRTAHRQTCFHCFQRFAVSERISSFFCCGQFACLQQPRLSAKLNRSIIISEALSMEFLVASSKAKQNVVGLYISGRGEWFVNAVFYISKCSPESEVE